MSKKSKNFEESLNRLKEITEFLESDEVSLEDSIKFYEEGIKLSKECYSALEKAELKVKTLNEELEEETNEVKEELESDSVTNNIHEAISPQSLDLTKLNCLYVEDQVDSQILFKVQMKELRDVKFAVSFEEAQLVLMNHRFDFIVMDINLQGEYNGLDALKIIKTMPAFSSIPIIAVTAYVLPGDKEKFISAGFDDFISKPIFKEKMMESLEKIFLSKH